MMETRAPYQLTELITQPTMMIGLTEDELHVIRRLREMKARRHQLAIVQFTEKGLKCREVGKLEG